MLTAALDCWTRLQPYRSERLRCKNYTYGRQWKDIVTADDGRRVTEEDYIRSQGSAPLKNNLIRRIVRNVVGVFRNNYEIPAFDDFDLPGLDPGRRDALRTLYARNVRLNSLSEVFSRVMEEYLIGGLAVVRKSLVLPDLADVPAPRVLTHIVRPSSFFFNTDITDPRGWDVDVVGEIHDLSEEEEARLSTRRVVEVWRRTPGANDAPWEFFFLDDRGAVLRQGESPLPGGAHPYVMKAYPLIDGEIHSFVADCIDQQRYINRLITLNDWIIRAGAKGVLLVPECSIPDDLDLDDMAAQWSRFNGVIRYRARTGSPAPHQVNANSANSGIYELLQVQLKMMEDVSGINSALQGQLSNGAVSGTLYSQQTRHAMTGLTDILEGFRSFMMESSRLDIALLDLAS